MDDLVRIRSGDLGERAEMPTLRHAEVIDGKQVGSELGFRTDSNELYIGTKGGNVKIGDAKWEEQIANHEAKIKTLEAKIKTLEEQTETILNHLGAALPSE